MVKNNKRCSLKSRKRDTIMKSKNKIISPMSDLAFKKTLASVENKDILAGFIQDFFKSERCFIRP